ncbi:g11186 [Coccomyxa viridis]|uniref:G11186 protein n=1 Tax=Coccomyxa viridis TaxID=1274662 RepID=A0ABP1G7A7_9CHLO
MSDSDTEQRPQESSTGLSWGERLPALSAGVTQLSNSFTNLTQRISPARNGEQEEGQSWQRRIANLSGQLTGALSNAFSTAQSAATQGKLIISPDVLKALREGTAVVALESTIISHGMPYPQNLETARAVEDVVRQHGATPATIAILGGVPHIGLTDSELESLASRGLNVCKTSRRDLALVVAKGLDGATTVSATMLLAARAGIHVFVTGGIGGVHRGGEATMDVSADLTELGRTPVAVICAGAKSILDIPRTLEYLETQGVTVAAYGADEFPAFFTRHSGCRAPARLDSADMAAAMIRHNVELGLGSGAVIGVPIPEEHAAAGQQVEEATQQALQEAEQKGIQGSELTPFLLGRIRDLTGGASLEANIALIKHNAAVGARIAAALAAS